MFGLAMASRKWMEEYRYNAANHQSTALIPKCGVEHSSTATSSTISNGKNCFRLSLSLSLSLSPVELILECSKVTRPIDGPMPIYFSFLMQRLEKDERLLWEPRCGHPHEQCSASNQQCKSAHDRHLPPDSIIVNEYEIGQGKLLLLPDEQ